MNEDSEAIELDAEIHEWEMKQWYFGQPDLCQRCRFLDWRNAQDCCLGWPIEEGTTCTEFELTGLIPENSPTPPGGRAMSICEHCNCDHAELDPAPEYIYLQWIDDLGDGVTWCQAQINRCDPAYILATPKVVTAVNCHDELLAACKAALEELTIVQECVEGEDYNIVSGLTDQLRAAIDRATRGE